MDRIGAFLAMGGYGAYLWPAWIIAFILIGGAWVMAERRCRLAMRALSDAEARPQREARLQKDPSP